MASLDCSCSAFTGKGRMQHGKRANDTETVTHTLLPFTFLTLSTCCLRP